MCLPELGLACGAVRAYGIFLSHCRGGHAVMWTLRPLEQRLGHLWPELHRWGEGGVGRRGDRAQIQMLL